MAEDAEMQLAVLSAQFSAHQQAMDEFRQEVRAATTAITERLDQKVNGRLDRHAEMLSSQAATVATLGTKIATLNREVFDRSARGSAARPDAITIPMTTKTVLVVVGAMALVILALLGVKVGAL